MTVPVGPPPDWFAAHFPQLAQVIQIGAGGQKLVYSAVEATRGSVVLKLLRPPVDKEEARREILAVQTVASAHVPVIYQYGVAPSEWGDVFWIIEQLIPGETLRQIVAAGALPPTDILRLARDISEPLLAAETCNIVHRDVKPDNIMRSQDGTFWLLAFGLARHLGLSSLTATALPFGKLTPGYAPPEQFRNHKKQIDARSDLFALGVTLYEAATGVNPFRAGARDPLEMLKRVEKEPLPRLTLELTPAKEFEDLVAAMTQRRREHRPRTAREVVEWIADICRRQGI